MQPPSDFHDNNILPFNIHHHHHHHNNNKLTHDNSFLSNPQNLINTQHHFYYTQQQQQQHKSSFPINAHDLFTHNHFLATQQHHENQSSDSMITLPAECNWHPQQDFWKQANRNQCDRVSEEQLETNKTNLEENNNNEESNKSRVVFNELEAIYSLTTIGDINQASAASGSASGIVHIANNGSDTSIAKESSRWKDIQRSRKRKRSKFIKNSVVGVLENLVKRVMEYQESLQNKLLQVIERLEKERTEREEARRNEQAEKNKREDIDRAHEQLLASNREALIVSHIERITGQKVNYLGRDKAH